MTKIFGFLIVLLAAGLAGCSTLACGDPHPYMDSPASPLLKAPPGMQLPAPDPAYTVTGVTANTGKPTDRNAAGACLINPPQVVPTQAARKSQSAPKGTAGSSEPQKPEPTSNPASEVKTPAPTAGTAATVPPPIALGGDMQ